MGSRKSSQAWLEELLTEWSGRTTKKQRLTASRLHRQLVKEGFAVGETTVRGYVRNWRRERMEVFVPLVHRAGEEAQVDFFEVTRPRSPSALLETRRWRTTNAQGGSISD